MVRVALITRRLAGLRYRIQAQMSELIMIFIFLLFVIAFVGLGLSFHYAVKLYVNIKPEKEKLIRYVPFLLFLPSSFNDDGRRYYPKFIMTFVFSLICAFFVIALQAQLMN